MLQLKCNKCDSLNVTITNLTPPEPQIETIDEFADRGGYARMEARHAVLRYNTYLAKCGDCGYERKFSGL